MYNKFLRFENAASQIADGSFKIMTHLKENECIIEDWNVESFYKENRREIIKQENIEGINIWTEGVYRQNFGDYSFICGEVLKEENLLYGFSHKISFYSGRFLPDYLALSIALEFVIQNELHQESITLWLNSKMVYDQLEYRKNVKGGNYWPLNELCENLLAKIYNKRLEYREDNLANFRHWATRQ